MTEKKPAFIITIDTEPDNQWTNISYDKTENAQFIPRFQNLCEKYGFKPVYLTEYNMATDPFFIEYMNTKIREGNCEVGAHLHAWSTPPLISLTDDDCRNKPFLIDFSEETMKRKLSTLLERLHANFPGEIISHRAGRWAFNTMYLRLLKQNGIKIDCSVLPGQSIAGSSEILPESGASFIGCPRGLYEMDENDFRKIGHSGVFQVPMTVYDKHPLLRKTTALVSPGYSNRAFGMTKLRPERGNLASLLEIVTHTQKKKFGYIEFMLHSSEFMPGCSLAFPDAESIERMYDDLDILFLNIASHFTGMTLREFIERKKSCV